MDSGNTSFWSISKYVTVTEKDGAYDAVLPNSTPNIQTASTLFFASTEPPWAVVRPVLGVVLVH
jgi:GH43 family beta-xylosidase